MGLLKNWNYVTQLTVFPCAEPTPLIMVKTFFPAATLAMLDFFSWGCRDFLKARAGRAQPCGRFIKAAVSGGRGAKLIDQFDRWYKFAGPIDKALYAFLIADIGSTFAARWSMFAAVAQGCIPSEDNGTDNYRLNAPFVQVANQDTIIPYTINNPPPPSRGAGFFVPSGWYGQLHYTLTGRSLLTGKPAAFDTYIDVTGNRRFSTDLSKTRGYWPGASAQGEGTMEIQSRDQIGGMFYRPRVIPRERTLFTSGSATTIVSPLPILGQYVQPLSCFKNDITGYIGGFVNPTLFGDG